MQLELLVKEPIVRGGLALFPVFSTSPAGPAYLTGPEADAAGVLEVSELASGASVPKLLAHNQGSTPVLLVEGETLVGARQNRTLNVSLLAPANSTLAIPVACVEAGRWGREQPMGRSGRHTPTDLRRVKSAAVNRARVAGLEPHTDQSAVWRRVRDYSAQFEVPLPNQALDELYTDMQPELDAVTAGLEPMADQRGVIVAVGGAVRGIDLFDKPSTLAAYWKSLVAGYGVDAMRVSAPAPALDAAELFASAVVGATDTHAVAIGLGEDHVLTGPGITGNALAWDGAVVHLAAFAIHEDDGRPARPIDRRRWFRP